MATGSGWRKASYSFANSNCVEVGIVATEPGWRKASHSTYNGNCVEVEPRPGAVAVRDSKDPDGPQLAFAPQEWQEWVLRIKRTGPGASFRVRHLVPE